MALRRAARRLPRAPERDAGPDCSSAGARCWRWGLLYTGGSTTRGCVSGGGIVEGQAGGVRTNQDLGEELICGLPGRLVGHRRDAVPPSTLAGEDGYTQTPLQAVCVVSAPRFVLNTLRRNSPRLHVVRSATRLAAGLRKRRIRRAYSNSQLPTMSRHTDSGDRSRPISHRACAARIFCCIAAIAILAFSARLASNVVMLDGEFAAQLVLLAASCVVGVIAAIIVLKARANWLLPVITLMIWIAGPLSNAAVFSLLSYETGRDEFLASCLRIWKLQAEWADALGPIVLFISLCAATYLSVAVWKCFSAVSDGGHARGKRIALLVVLPALTALSAVAVLFSVVMRETMSFDSRLTEEWERTVQSFQHCDLRSSSFRFRLLAARAPSGVDPLLTVSMAPDVRDSIRYGEAPHGFVTLLSACKKRVAEGDVQAWIDVGMVYFAHDPTRAVEWLNAASEAGIADADVLLGHAFRLGIIGSVKSEKAAVMHYAKAARAGSAKAQYYLGEMLESTDSRLAARYYMAAAQQGLLAASYRLQAQVWSVRISPLSDYERYFWSLVFSVGIKRTEEATSPRFE
jgi:hypothetical protein